MSGDNQVDAGVWISGLRRDQVSEASTLLTSSFHADPNFVDLFPDEDVRRRVLPHVFATGLRDALSFGSVYAASSGRGLCGVAAWLPPGKSTLSLRRQLRSLPGLARMLTTAPHSVRRLVSFQAGAARFRPTQPYWYLQMIGVDPTSQGSGIGTRLLEPILGHTEETQQRCYLETNTKRNVAWYEKLGFRVINPSVSFTPGGPPNWTMLRHPKQRETYVGEAT